ncbi:DNA repair exonuclease [Ectobacillus funiculus]|uniref:metallophosphoesterase family protein n=1 Tax=Ectobacillus funiculus TaxID=137993 RepID=UPI00397A4ECE
MKLTFIHAADLHLDSPFKGMETAMPSFIFEAMKESTFQSFQRIVDTAIQEQVDFVVIPGDVYDREVRSLRAQLFLREQMRRLHDYDIQVYISHGNHDHLGGNGAGIELPNNVHVFQQPFVTKQPFHKQGQLLAYVYGFSYGQRAVTKRMAAQYEKEEEAPFHIGLLHGSLEGNHEHSSYAPFLLSELMEKQFDYWALGHIHKRVVLNEQPPIIYPGNIQGRHRKEMGEKGCYLVTLMEGRASYTFIPTASIIWKEAEISIEGMQRIDELLKRCEEVMNDLRHETEGVLLVLTISGSGPLALYLQDGQHVDELMAILAQGEERSDFVYPISCLNRTYSEEALKESPFLLELLQEADSFSEIDTVLRPFWSTSAARKVIETFSEEEKQDILEEAKRLLIGEMMKGGRAY